MSLLDVRDAAVKALYIALKPRTVAVTAHGGQLTTEELKRISTNAPAVLVACLGVPNIMLEGGVVTADSQWGAFVVTEDRSRVKRDSRGLLIMESVGITIPNNWWSGTAASTPKNITGRNLYSTALDKLGISLWVLNWSQKVDLEAVTTATYDNFERVYATYDVNETVDTVETEDQIEVPQ